MTSKTDPRTVVLSESFPGTLQNFPKLTGNTEVFITQTVTNERVTELVNFPTGDSGDIQYKSQEGFDASHNLNFNSASSTLNVTGNVATTALKTDNLLKADGTPWMFGGIPGGNNYTVQFNNSGAFSGNDNFTYNGSVNLLTIAGTVNMASSPTKLFGQISTLSILGGSGGQVLSTNGAGGLSWVDQSGGSEYDTIVSISGASGTVIHDFSLGSVFNHTSISSNFTVNIINLSLTTGLGVNITLVLNQGSTPYAPTAVQIAGVPQTILWQGGVIPTGYVNKKDLVSFSITNVGGTYTVFGQLISFG